MFDATNNHENDGDLLPHGHATGNKSSFAFIMLVDLVYFLILPSDWQGTCSAHSWLIFLVNLGFQLCENTSSEAVWKYSQ